MQKNVSLSSSEVEFIALSEAVKEVTFVVQLLGSLKIVAKYPGAERFDIIGAIFMASNIITTCCTWHVDIRYRYVNGNVKDEVVKIVFVTSADFDSDILNKNRSTELHEKHSQRMVIEKP